jgi:hypothetical protein
MDDISANSEHENRGCRQHHGRLFDIEFQFQSATREFYWLQRRVRSSQGQTLRIAKARL